MTRSTLLLVIGSFVLASLACGQPSNSSGDDTSSGDPSTSSSGPPTTSSASTSTTAGTSSSEGSSTAADSTEGSSSTGGEVMLAGACALEDLVGGFLVGMEADYTAFSGSVADGVVPVSVLEQIGADGDCVLLRRNNPFCDPLCMPGETCDFDGNCIAYPDNHDVGIVSVAGLLQPIMLDPVPPTFSYFDTSLPHPAFEPGAVITLNATGGDYDAFEMQGLGVAMIEPTAKMVTLSTDAPVEVEWTSTGSDATLRLVLSVDQHGLTPSKLICEGPDTGSLTISGELVTQFLEAGVSGFPSADYYLETIDSVQLEPGCVEFVVRSHNQTMLNVDGHTPCDAPNDCPKGQTCDLRLQTCV